MQNNYIIYVINVGNTMQLQNNANSLPGYIQAIIYVTVGWGGRLRPYTPAYGYVFCSLFSIQYGYVLSSLFSIFHQMITGNRQCNGC